MFTYFNNCVNWPRHDVDRDGGLSDMIGDAVTITRRTLLQHVEAAEVNDISEGLGYSLHHTQGLTMAADLSVSYHRSKLHGKTVYFFCWSAIEYVFTQA